MRKRRRFVSAVILAALFFGACGGGGGSKPNTASQSTTPLPTTATTSTTTTTTPEIDSDTVDAALDELIAAYEAVILKGVDKTDYNAVINSFRSARTHSEIGSRLTSSSIEGVPASIVASLSVAFTNAAARLDAFLSCAVVNIIDPTTACANEFSETKNAHTELGEAAGRIVPYGSRTPDEVGARLGL